MSGSRGINNVGWITTAPVFIVITAIQTTNLMFQGRTFLHCFQVAIILCLVRLKNPHAQHVVMFLRLYLNMLLKSRWRIVEFK